MREKLNGMLPLHLAANKGDISLIENLLNAGHDINTSDNEGRTVLHFAAIGGQLEAYKYLVDKGADASVFDKFDTKAESYLNTFGRGGVNTHSASIEKSREKSSAHNIGKR